MSGVGNEPDVPSKIRSLGEWQKVPGGAKSPRLGVRAVNWITGYNTYIPGISTLTGVAKVVAGAGWAGLGVLRVGLGLVAGGFSLLMPTESSNSYFLEMSISHIGYGLIWTSSAIREILRGAISAVPVVGNFIVWGADKLDHNSGEDKIADPLGKALGLLEKEKAPPRRPLAGH
jgi:hypothetical protein